MVKNKNRVDNYDPLLSSTLAWLVTCRQIETSEKLLRKGDCLEIMSGH